jgi:peptide/nickel transport system permease protein
MVAYTIRRLIAALVLLVVIVTATFFLFFAGSRDPARLACGKNCTPVLLDQTRKAYGYDKPMTTQFANYVSGLFVGRDYPEDKALRAAAPQLITHCSAPCLGYSPSQTSLVLNLIKNTLPVSFFVAIYAFLIWMIFGIAGGLIAALCRGRWPDRVIVGLALIGYSFPTFFIGLTLYSYVAIKWQWVSIPQYVSPTGDIIGFLQGAILPAVTLALIYVAAYIRLTRAYVLEAMGEDYVRTARAKGLSEWRVLLKHTLRGALTPLTTIAGLDLGALFAGAAITEYVFNFNGLGRLTVQSAVNLDLPTDVGIVLVSATFILVANIIVDILYAFIDPRVKY